jgi:enamine deaminase RidA (YjgF/YER057c/UK114 family)
MLDGLTMEPQRLDPGSALSAETRFRYAQQNTLVSAEYAGGSIHRGYLVGRLDGQLLEFRYVQLSNDGQVDAGQSRCEVITDRDGIRLIERYTWATRDGVGTNVFVQCVDNASVMNRGAARKGDVITFEPPRGIMKAGTVDRRLGQLKIELPIAAKPVANFVPCVQTGSTLYVSGQVPAWNGELRHVGKVGREIPLEEARTAARLCALNVLAQAKAYLGSLDRIRRVCTVQGFVNAVPEFTQHPAVINGASDVIVEILGEAVGSHARFAVGAGSLPFNVAVEVAAVLEAD